MMRKRALYEAGVEASSRSNDSFAVYLQRHHGKGIVGSLVVPIRQDGELLELEERSRKTKNIRVADAFERSDSRVL